MPKNIQTKLKQNTFELSCLWVERENISSRNDYSFFWSISTRWSTMLLDAMRDSLAIEGDDELLLWADEQPEVCNRSTRFMVNFMSLIIISQGFVRDETETCWQSIPSKFQSVWHEVCRLRIACEATRQSHGSNEAWMKPNFNSFS